MRAAKKNKKFSLFILIITIFVAALAFVKYNFSPALNFQDTVSVKEYDYLSRQPNSVILDVRTPEEYSDDHLINSVLIDFNSPNFKSEIARLDKDKTYLIHCRTDRRSGHTMQLMADLGFKNMYLLKGGILAWKQEGKPTVKEPK